MPYKKNLVYINKSLFLLPFTGQSICVLCDAKMDFYLQFIKDFWLRVRTYSLPKSFWFLAMSTLYRRCLHYISSHTKPKPPLLTPEQRSDLGVKVWARYLTIKPDEEKMHYSLHTNEEGTFKVREYPRYFSPTIDLLIKEYYANLPEPPVPKKRTRIKASPKPIFSSKP